MTEKICIDSFALGNIRAGNRVVEVDSNSFCRILISSSQGNAMSQIIDANSGDDESQNLVRIGDGANMASLKLYQDVYHQITGRTEQIGRRYKDDFQITIADIDQLNVKITQLCDVHNVIAQNQNISIFYEKERREQFTSFERFKLYNSSATSPCLSLVFKYNFSIIPGGMRKPQEYVVTIKLTSRIGISKQMREDDDALFMRGYFLSRSPTAEVSVDYADYVIARGFMEAFDEWAKGVKKTKSSGILNFIRKRTHYFPEIFRVIGGVLITVFASTAIPAQLADVSSNALLAKFLVVYGGGAYLIISLMGLAGGLIEQAIDGYSPLSFLNLNKGDENLIEEYRQEYRPQFWRFILGSVLSVALSVLANRLDKFI